MRHAAVLMAAMAAGCVAQQSPAPPTTPTIGEEPREPAGDTVKPHPQYAGNPRQPIPIAPSCEGFPADSAPVALHPVGIEGNLLHLSAQYGGGCEEHEFHACWEGTFMESFPVQTRIRIFHEDHGDTCKALIQKDLYLDLAPIREAYRRGYRAEEGIIVIHVTDVRQQIEYRF